MSLVVSGLCRLLIMPLRWLPRRVHAGGLSLILNHLLSHALAGGATAFLRGRAIGVEFTDLGLHYRLTHDSDGFVAASGRRAADVRVAGDLAAFLALATLREAPAALFAQCRLRVDGGDSGDRLTAFMMGFATLAVPTPARRALERIAELHARRCASGAARGAPADA